MWERGQQMIFVVTVADMVGLVFSNSKLSLPRVRCCVVSAVLILLLAGCATQPEPMSRQQRNTSHDTASDTRIWTNARYNIRIRYPKRFELHRTFHETYQLDAAWKTFTGPDSPPGQPIVALMLPESNRVTTGAIRVGASRDKAALRTCTDLPFAARPDSVGQTLIDGVAFTTYRAGGAGMSHYLTVHSYRAIHNGTCYAIDVLVYGTNPNVYAPPRTPPFSHAQAYARLTPVVMGLQFTSASTSGPNTR